MNDYVGAFDTRPVADLPAQPMLFDLAPLAQTRGYWQRGLALQGADMRKIIMAAGQSTNLVLHWAASAPLSGDEEATSVVTRVAGKATVLSVRPLGDA